MMGAVGSEESAYAADIVSISDLTQWGSVGDSLESETVIVLGMMPPVAHFANLLSALRHGPTRTDNIDTYAMAAQFLRQSS